MSEANVKPVRGTGGRNQKHRMEACITRYSRASVEANVSEANVKPVRGTGGRNQKHRMEACGIKVTRNPAEMGRLLKSVL